MPVETTAVVVREQMVGKTVQQDGVLVHAATAAAVVDARGHLVGALRVRRHCSTAPITTILVLMMMIRPVKRDLGYVQLQSPYFEN